MQELGSRFQNRFGPKSQYYTVFGVFKQDPEEDVENDKKDVENQRPEKDTYDYLEQYLKRYDEHCELEPGPEGGNCVYFKTCGWEDECIYIPEKQIRLFVMPGKCEDGISEKTEKADLRWRPYERKTWLVRFCEFILGSGKVVISEGVRDKVDRLNKNKMILLILVIAIICLQISKCL